MYSVTDAKSRRGSLRCCGYFFFILGPPRRVRSIFASRATSARIGSRVCLCVRSGTTSTILSRRSETDCLAHAYANRAHFPCISSAQTFIHAQSLIELCRVLSAPLLIIDKEDCIAKAFIRLLHRHHRVDYSGFWRRGRDCDDFPVGCRDRLQSRCVSGDQNGSEQCNTQSLHLS